MDDITTEIGITKPAIYYYFNAKEDLLVEICFTHINNLNNGVQAIINSDLSIEEKVVQLFANSAMQYHNNRDIAEAFLREAAHLSLEKRKELSSLLRRIDSTIREYVDMGITEGIFRPINSKHVVHGINGMVSWLGNWYDPAGNDDIHLIVDAYIDFIRHGLLSCN